MSSLAVVFFLRPFLWGILAFCIVETVCKPFTLFHTRGGGGGGTQMLFGRGCAAEASKPVPIFKGHFGGKGYPLLGVWRKRVPIIRDF